jgi:hypothetical protein
MNVLAAGSREAVGKNRLHLDLYTEDQEGRWSGCCNSERPTINGLRNQMRTSLCSRIPKATSSA